MNKIYNDINIEVNKEDLDKKSVIYKLTFPNGKVYIGQTINKLRLRLISHCSDAHKVNKKYTLKDRAIIKYQSFICEVLYQGEELDLNEVKFIKKFNSLNKDFGYNLDSGGCLNKTHSDISKQKMSESQKGRIQSEETRLKISKANIGMNNPNAKSIIVTELSTGIETKFTYVKEAAEYFGINHCNISMVLIGKRKTFSKKQYTAKYESTN